MFIITLEDKDKDKQGAFSIINEDGEKIILFFQEYDDAERYRLLLEEQGYPDLDIVEYEDDVVLKTAQITGHDYTIITPYDLVVPPNTFK